jgi:hypothetical protein
LAAGVKVSVPSAPIAGWVANSAVLSFVTRKFSAWLDSLDGPGKIFVVQLAIVCGPASSATDTLEPFVNDGGSLTAEMVTAIAFVALCAPPAPVLPWSSTVTPMVSGPE